MSSTSLATLLSKQQLCDTLGVSARTIENMVKDRRFPSPVRIGKYVYWSEVAVQKWQRRLFSEQEAWDV